MRLKRWSIEKYEDLASYNKVIKNERGTASPDQLVSQPKRETDLIKATKNTRSQLRILTRAINNKLDEYKVKMSANT